MLGAKAVPTVIQQIPNAIQTSKNAAEDLQMLYKRFQGAKGLRNNPIYGRNPRQLRQMFEDHPRRFRWRSESPQKTPETGEGSYVDPKTNRGYHIDAKGKGEYPDEPTHVDVHRTRMEKVRLEKRGLEKMAQKRRFWTDHE